MRVVLFLQDKISRKIRKNVRTFETELELAAFIAKTLQRSRLRILTILDGGKVGDKDKKTR